MDCEVCHEAFNAIQNEPKVLPCGHTFCATCLQRLRHCPTCRRPIPLGPRTTNFTLLGLLQHGSRGPQPRPAPAPAAPVALATPATAAPPAAHAIAVAAWEELDTSRWQPADALRFAQAGVRRLRLHVNDLFNRRDPGWALEVLKATAPVVEEVELFGPTEMHVLEAHRAPRLTKLHIERFDNKLPDNGGLVPVLPPLPGPSRLKTLCIGSGSSMRLAVLRQLLQAHGDSLESLQFRCEAATDGNAAFVSPSKWMPQLRLPRLRKLYVEPPFLGFGSFSNDGAEDMAYGARVGQLQAGMPHVEVKWAAFFSQDMVDSPVYDFVTEQEHPDLLFF